MAKLTTIEGIGPSLSEKLESAGIGSTEKLLEKGSTAAGRKALAEETGIDAKRLMRFVNHADLMRISGIGGEMSELLEAAGVDTVPELAQRNAENLHGKLKEINDEKKLVRALPGSPRVAEWVEQAKGMDRIVHH